MLKVSYWRSLRAFMHFLHPKSNLFMIYCLKKLEPPIGPFEVTVWLADVAVTRNQIFLLIRRPRWLKPQTLTTAFNKLAIFILVANAQFRHSSPFACLNGQTQVTLRTYPFGTKQPDLIYTPKYRLKQVIHELTSQYHKTDIQ